MATTDKPKIRPDDVHTATKQAVDHFVPPSTPITPVKEEITVEEKDGIVIPQGEADPIRAAPAVSYDPGNAQTAQIIAKMQARIEELERKQIVQPTSPAQQNRDEAQGPSGYPWQYYRRPDRSTPGQPDPGAGWIVVGPGGAGEVTGKRDVSAYTAYIQKGEIPINEYGSCPVPGTNPTVRDIRSGGVFRPMLEKGGGKEFPASQILAYAWHVNPPLPGLTFPQVEDVRDKILHFICPDCDRSTWLLDDDAETMQSCFRHLRTNTGDGRHAYPREEASMYLESLGFPAMAKFAAEAKAKAFSKFLPGRGAPNLPPAEALT